MRSTLHAIISKIYILLMKVPKAREKKQTTYTALWGKWDTGN